MEASLLTAAEALLLEEGPQAVTLRAVGAKVGLARSSVYEYFASSDDLLGAVVEAAFEAWSAAVIEAFAAETDPAAIVERYARVTLALVARGDHRPLASIGRLELPPTRRARIGALHDDLLAPLEAALAALGRPQPRLSARLLQGIVDAATRAIERGHEPTVVIDEAARLIRSAIGRHAASRG